MLLGGRYRLNLEVTSIGDFVVLNALLLQEAEDVVENEVSIRLLREEERLHKLTPGLPTVRHLTDDLNNNPPSSRRLSIN
ncbi:hypothetical protein EW145_g6887 [Phellinidium pouzarii]|uniref:Uncharacterized protein n=1 Tax=Phellinidium pouzarii TaxID=167371 RepID=A0A4S4KX02_9AGAM|nr:hypothetical protein EW145_g6887 [Phellinidium pouzarii]